MTGGIILAFVVATGILKFMNDKRNMDDAYRKSPGDAGSPTDSRPRAGSPSEESASTEPLPAVGAPPGEPAPMLFEIVVLGVKTDADDSAVHSRFEKIQGVKLVNFMTGLGENGEILGERTSLEFEFPKGKAVKLGDIQIALGDPYWIGGFRGIKSVGGSYQTIDALSRVYVSGVKTRKDMSTVGGLLGEIGMQVLASGVDPSTNLAVFDVLTTGGGVLEKHKLGARLTDTLVLDEIELLGRKR